MDKGSDEYKKRRERNNVAVRKSREKAKLRSRETERRVAELSKENQLYRAQYEELRREFNVLKSLLLKTGLTEQVIEDEAQRHTNSSTVASLAVSGLASNGITTTGNNSISANNNQNTVTIQHQIQNQVSNNVHSHHMVVTNNHHHLVSSLNSHVGSLKGIQCNPIGNTQVAHHHQNQNHYTATQLDSVDQWTDGIGAYVDDWAS